MKGVWFSLVALALGVAGVVPSIAEAAGLTRAEVLAAIAGRDVSGGVPGEAPLAATAGSGALK